MYYFTYNFTQKEGWDITIDPIAKIYYMDGNISEVSQNVNGDHLSKVSWDNGVITVKTYNPITEIKQITFDLSISVTPFPSSLDEVFTNIEAQIQYEDGSLYSWFDFLRHYYTEPDGRYTAFQCVRYNLI